MKDSNQPKENLAQFKTNGFSGNPLNSIAIATVVGMAAMFLTISIGAPILISMGALFSGILLVYGFRVASITYTIKDTGIKQNIRRFLPYKINKKEEERFVDWATINSIKNDWDRTRSGDNYEYIKLYLSKSPSEIWITDQHDKQGFNTFKQALIIKIDQNISGKGDEAKTSTIAKKSTAHIKLRKSFYDTGFAKVVTLFFILLCLAIFIYGQQNGWKLQHYFRFQIIIIPGTFYMIHRVFIKS